MYRSGTQRKTPRVSTDRVSTGAGVGHRYN
jgi:hypothetical protein